MSGLVIPEVCGAMLLPDCVLFPQGAMPLNIFESRYRKMLEDSQTGNPVFAIFHRINDGDDSDLASCTAEIGTIGLIRASKQQSDGTSELLLHGFMRVRALEWLYDRPYPTVRIEPVTSSKEESQEAPKIMDALKDLLESALSEAEENVQHYFNDLLKRADTPELLSDVVSQQFVQDPKIRQTLLGEPEPENRLRMLCKLFVNQSQDS